MITVKTKIGPSTISGMGIFAGEDISKGTLVWEFVPKFDQKLTQAEAAQLPKLARQYLIQYGYVSKRDGTYILAMDHSRFMNHSDNPNLVSGFEDGFEEDVARAAPDIKKNEELTVDYQQFDDGLKEDYSTKSPI